jgi:hypothetical protein
MNQPFMLFMSFMVKKSLPQSKATITYRQILKGMAITDNSSSVKIRKRLSLKSESAEDLI